MPDGAPAILRDERDFDVAVAPEAMNQIGFVRLTESCTDDSAYCARIAGAFITNDHGLFRRSIICCTKG
jgi:hypothetical protein